MSLRGADQIQTALDRAIWASLGVGSTPRHDIELLPSIERLFQRADGKFADTPDAKFACQIRDGWLYGCLRAEYE